MREFAMFVQESSLQVPVTTPVVWPSASPNCFYARLDQGDSLTMRPRPAMVTVPYGGGVNIPAFTVSDKFVCTGRYTTKLYAGPFSQFLFQWAAQQVNTGNSAPWTTTSGLIAPGNLASVSIFHAIQRPQDGTWKAQWYKGVMVNSWSFTMSEDSQIGTMTLELTGCVAQGNPWDGSSDPAVGTSPGVAPTLTGSGTVNPPATNNLPINPYLFVNAAYAASAWFGRRWNGVSRIGTNRWRSGFHCRHGRRRIGLYRQSRCNSHWRRGLRRGCRCSCCSGRDHQFHSD